MPIYINIYLVILNSSEQILRLFGTDENNTQAFPKSEIGNLAEQ